MKIGILSDTHGYTHPKLFEFFGECDEIWHAGDIGSMDVLTELEAITKVRFVYGNCDGWEFRGGNGNETLIFNCEEHKVMLRHIVGKPGKYTPESLEIIKREKPTIVVAGHSHILRVKNDPDLGCLFINPGAAGRYGIHTQLTFLRFDINGRELSNLEVWDEPKAIMVK